MINLITTAERTRYNKLKQLLEDINGIRHEVCWLKEVQLYEDLF